MSESIYEVLIPFRVFMDSDERRSQRPTDKISNRLNTLPGIYGFRLRRIGTPGTLTVRLNTLPGIYGFRHIM